MEGFQTNYKSKEGMKEKIVVFQNFINYSVSLLDQSSSDDSTAMLTPAARFTSI